MTLARTSPSKTEVFRLESPSPELVAKWLETQFPAVSQIDRERIAEFSDGNFRVAKALAETLRKGETLGQLKNRDLFARIFDQRAAPDLDLMAAAEDLALLYSYNGEDAEPNSELALLSKLRDVPSSQLFRATIELKRRGVVQSRGRWRAILPHAIANRLAALGLERIPASEFHTFTASLTPRMLRSMSRRLGFLHDSTEAQAVVSRWLRPGGYLADLSKLAGDGFTVLKNVAPVAPEAILLKIRDTLSGAGRSALLAPGHRSRTDLIGLTKALAYEEQLFDDAAMTLAEIRASEAPDSNTNSAEGAFKSLYNLYLSGTRAPPEQRRRMIRKLASSDDPESPTAGARSARRYA